MERNDGNDGRNRIHPEDGLHDTSLPPNLADLADQQQQQQQEYRNWIQDTSCIVRPVPRFQSKPKQDFSINAQIPYFVDHTKIHQNLLNLFTRNIQAEQSSASLGGVGAEIDMEVEEINSNVEAADNPNMHDMQDMHEMDIGVQHLFDTDTDMGAPADDTTQQAQNENINFEQFQFGEFQRFVLDRVHRWQKLAYKLRILNKSGKEIVEKGIQETKISLENTQCLAKSQLSGRIKNIDVSIRGPIIEVLQDLPILSSVHFPSIQRINLNITGNFELGISPEFEITIQEPLILTNVNITNESNLAALWIKGKYEVVIRDCTYNRLAIRCYGNAEVSVVNTRFQNSGMDGFICSFCDSLLMNQIMIKDCGWDGCHVEVCGNVSMDNIQVISCGYAGILFWYVKSFKLRNAFVQGCGSYRQSGIYVKNESVGEIQNVHVQGCKGYGINVIGESKVRYAQTKCENNEQGDFHIQEDCEFLGMN